MKRLVQVMVLLVQVTLPCVYLTGCTPTTTTPAQLAPGYVNSYDQQFAQDIAAAETFYRDQQNNINARTYVPTPTELTALNALGVAISSAKSQSQTLQQQIPAGVK